MKNRSRLIEIVANEEREVFIGKRGGTYYIDENGNRVYLRSRKKVSRKYNTPKGAFARYLENQRFAA